MDLQGWASQLNLVSAEEDTRTLKNTSFVLFLMALAYSHPVIESCKAAWQLKLA